VVCGKKRGFWKGKIENEIERKRRHRNYRQFEN